MSNKNETKPLNMRTSIYYDKENMLVSKLHWEADVSSEIRKNETE